MCFRIGTRAMSGKVDSEKEMQGHRGSAGISDRVTRPQTWLHWEVTLEQTFGGGKGGKWEEACGGSRCRGPHG